MPSSLNVDDSSVADTLSEALVSEVELNRFAWTRDQLIRGPRLDPRSGPDPGGSGSEPTIRVHAFLFSHGRHDRVEPSRLRRGVTVQAGRSGAVASIPRVGRGGPPVGHLASAIDSAGSDFADL